MLDGSCHCLRLPASGRHGGASPTLRVGAVSHVSLHRLRSALRRGRLVFSTLLVLALAPTTAAGRPTPDPQPPARVRDIELRADAAVGRGLDLRTLLAFAPGVRLTEAAVRRTLSNLYATGRVAEAEIFTRPAPPPEGRIPGSGLPEDGDAGGRWVTAVVVARGHTRVAAVEIAGEPGLGRSSIRRALEQKPGATLSEERLLRGHYALQDLYAERGYRRAEVRLEVGIEPGGALAHVTYYLRSGPRATVGAIDFSGDPGPFADDELRGALRTQVGAPYGGERIAADRERLRSFVAERGHPTAAVGAPREVYDPATNRIHLTFPLTAGPAIALEVVGAARRRLERRGLLPFLDEGSFDEQLIAQSCQLIAAHLQRKGHYHARADYRSEPGEDGSRVTIEVDPGPIYRLTEIRFAGNDTVSAADLSSLMNTSVKKSLSPGSGRLVPDELSEDIANLRSYYLLQGFTEVEIGPETTYEDGDRLEISIPIREGPRQRLVDLTLSGHRALDSADLLRGLPLKPGGPFHPVLLDDSVNILRTLYEEQGYRAASVTPELDWNDEGTLVDVRLAIDEGRRTRVDRIVLRGTRRSRPEVLRHFIRLKSGDPISRRRLLEIERELYRLGIFSRVDVEVAPSAESAELRDVIVRLEEGKRWRLAYGLSYHSEDGIGGLLSVTRSNVGGRGDRVQLDVRGSGLDRRFRLLWDRPSFLRGKIPLTVSLFEQEEERESFIVNDLGAQVSLIKDLGPFFAGVVYEYRLVDLSEETVDPDEIAREDRELEISSLTPNLFIDRRDDPLDASRGWSTSLQLEYAFPFVDAETEFLKLFWQQTYYQPLGRLGLLAGSVRLGAIEPLDDEAELDTTVPAGLASALVPVSERFFGGGRTSHRAFERDQLGIVGETLLERSEDDFLELGGNGLLVLNLDYRFPIAGPLGGTVFFDLGNVWADWRDLDGSDLEAGAGLGLRYRSPIGPVRVEVGWKIDSELGESDKPVFFLSFGNPF